MDPGIFSQDPHDSIAFGFILRRRTSDPLIHDSKIVDEHQRQ
jgi:hypothetical protein